jgi:predicted transcriptional regulator
MTNQKGRTPDEKFLIKLYQTAMANGDPFQEVDSRGIAHAIGHRETAVKNIIKHLAQANFIKKRDDTTVYLTQHGCNFVLDELGDQ